jgi:hypothetical protein
VHATLDVSFFEQEFLTFTGSFHPLLWCKLSVANHTVHWRKNTVPLCSYFLLWRSIRKSMDSLIFDLVKSRRPQLNKSSKKSVNNRIIGPLALTWLNCVLIVFYF